MQTFEFSLELTWKILKDIAEYDGYEAASPRNAIRKAPEENHISSENSARCLE